MANTYTKLYIHFIFGVRGKGCSIPSIRKAELHQYISGLLRQRDAHVYAINSMPDHIHILVSMRPNISPSELMKDVKAFSSKWINDNRLTPFKFNWQTGFAAFSHGQLELPRIIEYIENQEEHHRKRTYQEEYIAFLKRYEIKFDSNYVFDPQESRDLSTSKIEST